MPTLVPKAGMVTPQTGALIGLKRASLLQHEILSNVAHGSDSAAPVTGCRDRYTSMCGRLRVGKDFFHVCSIGRCAHVFGL